MKNIKVMRFPANWKKYGKKAGPIRNETMAKNAEGLVAIWDGQSRGTTSMINLATRYGYIDNNMVFFYKKIIMFLCSYRRVASL